MVSTVQVGCARFVCESVCPTIPVINMSYKCALTKKFQHGFRQAYLMIVSVPLNNIF